jgi:hypothetical protein
MIRIGTLREAISAPNNANITPTPSNPMAYFFNNQLIITPGVDDAKLFYLKSFPKIADDATEITKLGQANAAYIPELFEEFIFAQAIVYAGQRYFQRDDLSQADREKSAEVFDSLYAKLEMEKKPFEEYLNKAPK